MNFIVSSSALLKPLQTLSGVLNTSNTLPILDHFLFEVKDKTLSVTATDLETTMSASIAVESDIDGSVAVPARLLLDTLKTFPEQPLTFSLTDQNTIEISSNYGKYALAYATADEYPKAVAVKDADTVSIQSHILADAISNTLFASISSGANMNSKPFLLTNCMAFSSSSSLRLDMAPVKPKKKTTGVKQ